MTTTLSRENTDAAAEQTPSVQPAVDVYEGPADYLVLVDLPGVPENELQLTLDKSELTLEASGVWGDASVTFSRSFSLPTLIDSDKLDASLKAGVLTLRLPKRPDAQPRRIPIASA